MNDQDKVLLKARLVSLLMHDAKSDLRMLFYRVKPDIDALNEEFGKDAVTEMLKEVVEEVR